MNGFDTQGRGTENFLSRELEFVHAPESNVAFSNYALH